MSKAVTKINWEGHDIVYTWIPEEDIKKYSLITQIYGICFDENDRVLIINDKRWQIPGGTPENNETEIETLKRELIEESQVEVKNIKFLGVQEVSFPNNPNKAEGDLYYQARFIAQIDKIHPMQSDPATGREYERKFIAIDEIDNYIDWGEVGTEMFKDAWATYSEIKKE